jgi:hypothetical protein
LDHLDEFQERFVEIDFQLNSGSETGTKAEALTTGANADDGIVQDGTGEANV